MKIFQNLASKLDKPVTIEYAMEYLRAKGIATGECGSNNLSFKLYDMNWDMYIEEGRLGLRNSFNVGSDINMDCLMKAMNQLNSERWVVKSFIETFTPNDENGIAQKESFSSIVFSLENFCYSESAFDKIYEFAIYAMCDGIDFHRKCYSQYLSDKMTQNQTHSTKIGFHAETEKTEGATVALDQQHRRKIGFI